MLRDSYDWSDMSPNAFRGATYLAMATMRLPFKSLLQGKDLKMVPSLVVDVYHTGAIHLTNSGVQAMFYGNGAGAGCDEEFGIKLFNTFHEAYCAYNRQLVAASEGVAPPVGRMVLFSHTRPTRRVSLAALWFEGEPERVWRWGYQTCVATTHDPYDDDTEYWWDQAHDAFQEHIDACRMEVDIPSCFSEGPEDLEVCSRYRQGWLDDWIEENRPPSEWHDFGLRVCFEYDYRLLPSERELRKAMAYRDDPSEVFRYASGGLLTINNLVGWNEREWNPMWAVSMVNLVRSQREEFLETSTNELREKPDGDLHAGNVGLWGDDMVIIDWGYHVMGGCANNPHTQEHCENRPSLSWEYTRDFPDVVVCSEAGHVASLA